jgi:hypothetical protein
MTVLQVLTDVTFLPREWRLRVEVLFAFVGVVCELVLLGLGGLLGGHATRDECGVWGRAVGGQWLEGLRNTHHELVGHFAEALHLALELSDLVFEGVILLLNVEDM